VDHDAETLYSRDRALRNARWQWRLPFGVKLAQLEAGLMSLIQQNVRNGPFPAKDASNVPVVRSGEPVLRRQSGHTPLSVSLRAGSDVRSPATRGLRLRLDDCRLPGSPFDALVRETALRVGVERRALAVRVLLHLPRVASHEGWITRAQVQRELRIQARRLREDARAAMSLLPIGKFLLSQLIFEEIDPSCAAPLLAALHYLRSARAGARYFALVDPVDRRPVSLCSVSPLQWRCVSRAILADFDTPSERVWDISRIYCIDNAPRNAISSLLSRVRTYIRHNGSIELLVTAVDPNMGFTGSSYRAANWQEWITVKARPYLYEDCQYVSPRQLRERYGTSSLIELQSQHPGRFQHSRAKMLDSMIFCCRVNGETSVVPLQERRRLRR
jgi:hypothetical protein